MSDYAEFLTNLLNEQWFQQFMAEELLPGIPNIPKWDPESDNTEEWKARTMQAEGYQLCLTKLGIFIDE